MSPEVEAGLIAAIVALITAGITGFLTWQQIQREREATLLAKRSVEKIVAFTEERSRWFGSNCMYSWIRSSWCSSGLSSMT